MSIIAGYMVPHPPIILKEIGKGEEAKLINTSNAYEKIAKQIASYAPDTIIISSPHTTMYADYFHVSPGTHAKGDFVQFGAPGVKIEADYDEEFTRKLNFNCKVAQFPGGILGERMKELDHGTMIPLSFIQKYYKDFKLVRAGLSGLSFKDHYAFGMLLKKTAEQLNRRVVYIASGDLSHCLKEDGPYGYAKEGSEYEAQIMNVMEKADFLSLLHFDEEFTRKAMECGHRSFAIMAGILDKESVKTEKLSHEAPFGVGYGICSYEVTGQDLERNFKEKFEVEEKEQVCKKQQAEDAYVALARAAINGFIKKGKVIVPGSSVPEEMKKEKAGVFVSLKKEGRLRGCIGTVSPVQDNIAEEIVNNAVSAAVNDSRFAPVSKEEIDELIISVDVLKQPERVASEKELNPKKYGVIVSTAQKRGLLLPDLDGVDTAKQQVEIAKQKAGITEKEKVTLERFEVERHY